MPPPIAESARQRDRGTASVELVAVVPLLAVAVLATAQLALAGGALWSAGLAARAGARAALVGGDPRPVARRALPAPLRGGSQVEGGGEVSVRVRVPRVLPGLPPIAVTARTALGAGDG